MTRLMTVAAVGDALCVSSALVLREIHRGHIPYLKIGGTYRIPAEYVTDQLEKVRTSHDGGVGGAA